MKVRHEAKLIDLTIEEENYHAELYFYYFIWGRHHQGTGMDLKTPMMKIHDYALKNLIYNGNF